MEQAGASAVVGLRQRKVLARDGLAQMIAFDVGHGDEVPALVHTDLVNGDDVGGLRGLCLTLEALERLPLPGHMRRQELERDFKLEFEVLGEKHLTHPAFAEFFVSGVTRR